MRKVMRIVSALGVLFGGPSVFAQGNCSYITYLLVSDTKNVGTACDTHFNQSVTETRTYNVQCVDQTNNNNAYYNAASTMTGTGTTSLSCGGPRPVDCSPRFETENQNAGFVNASDNMNKFYNRVWPREQSGGQCTDFPMSQDFKQCAAVQCAAAGGGGGAPDDPPPGPVCSGGTTAVQDGGLNGCTSPIIIDTEGEGFHLTAAETGVSFDISGTGHPIQMGWTDAHFHNAFLALPGPDGLVGNGKELFGNFTPQPTSNQPNGFLALAEFDKPENGGNGDGIIDEHDQVFSKLRLWIDENHDGISQPGELHILPELGVFSLSLNYKESRRTDEFGNVFRFRTKVNAKNRNDNFDVGTWAFDVFLATGN